MIALDSQKWAELRDAYGTAEDLAELLRFLYGNPTDSRAWNDAWGRLCHQNTIYSASLAAIPHIVILSKDLHSRDRLNPILLVGAIVSNLEGSGLNSNIDPGFNSHVARAFQLLMETIQYSGLTEDELRHSLSAVVAFKGFAKLADQIETLDCVET